jgi:hypothetical protein
MAVAICALTITMIAALFLPTLTHADVIQIKCTNSGAGLRFTKVIINNNTYYTDQFGKISIPNLRNSLGKNVTVYVGSQPKSVQISSPGEITVPCGD